MVEIENLKTRKNVLTQISSPSYKVLDKSIKCNQCDVLKSENMELQITIDKFTKQRYNSNLLLGNERVSYTKVELGYEPKTISKCLNHTCHAKKKTKIAINILSFFVLRLIF